MIVDAKLEGRLVHVSPYQVRSAKTFQVPFKSNI
jgi:hypothetical protein